MVHLQAILPWPLVDDSKLLSIRRPHTDWTVRKSAVEAHEKSPLRSTEIDT